MIAAAALSSKELVLVDKCSQGAGTVNRGSVVATVAAIEVRTRRSDRGKYEERGLLSRHARSAMGVTVTQPVSAHFFVLWVFFTMQLQKNIMRN